MTEISRVNLFGKLNEECYQTIESATVFCKLRTNPYVEVAHWLHQILAQDSDVQRLVQHFELDAGTLARDLTSALDRLPRGASSITDLSTQVEESVERAWVYASLLFGESRVRTGHLLVAWLKTRTLRNTLLAISKEFGKVNVDTLTERFSALTAHSAEGKLTRSAPQSSASASDASPGAPAQLGRQEALARYTIDLTERARAGEIDRIVGRDEEIRQLVQILMRRRQNNPILTGEAGVGKTAVVEGFAQRLAMGDVPPQLKDVSLRALDIGLLQAGASMKGEFEGRLRQVIDEVQSSPKPIILFVDEAHTLIGAGGAQGTGDAANLLKPALARGKLRTIGATTWAEYKKYIEGDPALTRRFQVVKVDEPSEAKAVLMMRGSASALESHHRVQILDEAIVAAVKLSKRYVPDRQLPDKSVSLLDTACARVAVSQHAVPAELEDSQRRIDALSQELEIIARERTVGVDVTKRASEAELALAAERDRLSTLEARFASEKALVDKILELRARLRQAGETPPDGPAATRPAVDASLAADSLAELRSLEASLSELQGELPLILPSVTEQAVALVVAEWTGIPTGRMVRNEIEAVLNASELLSRRVVGQDHALDMISRRIQTARAGLENPGKPIGVFLLAGPSGVGKTETALALAEGLYGGEQNVITINMSEFQESHSVSTLKGAPPGYVGYGEGGVLTEAVRRRPYSVVLLDEIEKAHPDVHEVFFQVFDKGFMEDGQGTFIDFKNTIILATSNVGSDLIMSLCAGESRPAASEITERLRGPLLQVFPAALLGRMVVIPYFPLGDEMLRSIIRLQLDRVSRRVLERYAVPLDYDQSVIELVAQRCSEVESGGRAIDAVLTNSLLPQVSRELLSFTLQGKPVARVAVGVTDSQFSYSFD